MMRFKDYCRALGKVPDRTALPGYLNKLSQAIGWREFDLSEGVPDSAQLRHDLEQLEALRAEAISLAAQSVAGLPHRAPVPLKDR